MKIRALGLTTLCLALALTAVEQPGPRGGFQGPRGGDPEAREGFTGEREDRNPLGRLVTALDLNESHVGAAEALLAVRTEATEDIQQQLLASRESIPDLIAAGDPTPIGIAVLAQHALQEQLRAINEQFLADFNNLLTVTQQEQFASIREMGRGGELSGPAGIEGPGGRRGGQDRGRRGGQDGGRGGGRFGSPDAQ